MLLYHPPTSVYAAYEHIVDKRRSAAADSIEIQPGRTRGRSTMRMNMRFPIAPGWMERKQIPATWRNTSGADQTSVSANSVSSVATVTAILLILWGRLPAAVIRLDVMIGAVFTRYRFVPMRGRIDQPMHALARRLLGVAANGLLWGLAYFLSSSTAMSIRYS